MKQGIANIWLLTMIIIFIALMVAYVATTINYTAAFKMKNEMLLIIEKHRGLTEYEGETVPSIIPGIGDVKRPGSIRTINAYLRGYHYTTKGQCPKESEIPGKWYGVTNLNVEGELGYERVRAGEKYYYCFAKYTTRKREDHYQSVYYRVRMFYSFDVPFLASFLSIRVDGISNEVYGADPNDIKDITSEEDVDDFID